MLDDAVTEIRKKAFSIGRPYYDPDLSEMLDMLGYNSRMLYLGRGTDEDFIYVEQDRRGILIAKYDDSSDFFEFELDPFEFSNQYSSAYGDRRYNGVMSAVTPDLTYRFLLEVLETSFKEKN